jgi:hypothetical protein
MSVRPGDRFYVHDYEIMNLAVGIACQASAPFVEKNIRAKIERKSIRDLRMVVEKILVDPSKFFNEIGLRDARKANQEAFLAKHKCKPAHLPRIQSNGHPHATAQLPAAPNDSTNQMLTIFTQQQAASNTLLQQMIHLYSNTNNTHQPAPISAVAPAADSAPNPTATEATAEIPESDIEMIDAADAQPDETTPTQDVTEDDTPELPDLPALVESIAGGSEVQEATA